MLQRHVVTKMFLPDGRAARPTMENQQAAHIRIGQPERVFRIFAPILRGRAAMRATHRRIVRIAEVPELQKFLKGRNRLFHRFSGGRGRNGPQHGAGQGFNFLPEIPGNLHSLDAIFGIGKI